MRRSLVIIAIGVAAPARGHLAHADCNGKSCTTLVAEPVQGVDELLTRPTLTSATASVSAIAKDTRFKATIVPSQFFDNPYSSLVSELQFVIQTDTASSLTRLAVSTGYNPYSRRSDRVKEILAALNKSANCGGMQLDMLKTADDAKQAAYDKAATEYTADLAKADSDYTRAFAAAGQASDPATARTAALSAMMKAYAGAAEHRAGAQDAADRQWKAAGDASSKAVTSCVHRREATEWKVINSGWTPAVTVTASYDVFPYGRQPNAMDMTRQDTLEWHGGPGAQMLVEARPHERIDLQAWVTARHTRPTGDPGVKRATYLGGGATVSYLALSFLPASLDKIPSSYLKDGLLPGIGIGASGQVVDCRDGAACAKGRTTQVSVTPYVDILLSSSLQFRLSLPIAHYDAVDKAGSEIASTFSIAGAIGSP